MGRGWPVTECPVCKALGVCPVEDGVTVHRQCPPPAGWRPSREELEAEAVERRVWGEWIVEEVKRPSAGVEGQRPLTAAERLAAMEAVLAEVGAPPAGQLWAELVEVVDELRGDWDGEG